MSSRIRFLLVAAVLGIVFIRIIVPFWAGETHATGEDAADYIDAAKNLREGRGCVVNGGSFRLAHVMPAYPLLLAPFARSPHLHVWGLTLNGICLGLLIAAMLFALRRTLPGTAGTAVAVALLVLNPNLFYASTILMTDVVAAATFMWAVTAMLVFTFTRRPMISFVWIAAVGLFCGISGMMRAVLVLFPIVCLLGIAVTGYARRQVAVAIIQMAVLTSVCVTCFLPWGFRNLGVFGHFSVTTVGQNTQLLVEAQRAARLDHTGKAEQDLETLGREVVLPTASPQWGSPGFREWQLDRRAAEIAKQFAIQHFRLTIRRALYRFTHFVSPLANESYPALLRLWMSGYYIALWVVAGIGLLALRRLNSAALLFCLGAIVYFVIIHSVFLSLWRYRIPVEVMFAFLGGLGVNAAICHDDRFRTWLSRVIHLTILRPQRNASLHRRTSEIISVEQNDRVVAIVIGQLSHGGAERQCLELAEGIRDAGVFDPVVLCTSHHTEPYGDLLTKAGIEWFAAPEGCLRGIGKLWWLVRNVRRSRCRLLFGMLHTGNVYAGLAALILRIPFVASIRSATRQPLPLRLAAAFACRRAVVVVANSISAAHCLEVDMRISHQRVALVPNSVRAIEASSPQRSEIRRKLAIQSDAIVVGTAANLKAEKRVGFFLEVCKYVRDAWQQVSLNHALPHFIWLGDGPERDAVSTALAQLPAGLRSCVHFPGASLDVESYLSAFDVFVLTSAYEGMPNALLEAMSAGLPSVATDVPGTRDVLNAAPDIGILADPEHPGRFAESLVALLLDPRRMRVIGENAREYVREHHSLEEMTRRYCEVFRAVLEKDRSGSKPERRTDACP